MKKCINKDALIFNTEDWLYILKIQYEHGNCLLIAMAWRPMLMKYGGGEGGCVCVGVCV